MASLTTICGPILNPQADGSVVFHSRGALQWDDAGRITYVGDAAGLPANSGQTQASRGIILPPFLDCHIHIPQWPIRGRFCDGVDGCPAEGRLIAGLNRNVFPIEGKCSQADHVAKTVADFQADTLAHGVVGGAAYMTVHAPAVAQALRMLPEFWNVGLVLMNMNCPEYLRTDEVNLWHDVESLADEFGRRMILTDRFAVSVDSPLRCSAVELAGPLGLRMQTHLNEQVREKELVEKKLYPEVGSYTGVYARDGLLQRDAILAHCIHMREDEFDQLAGTSAVIAHCPTSNTLLGSGIMPLDRVIQRKIPYAICTDVGASSTTSILCEMAQFLKVHAGRSRHATPSEALYRTTLAAAKLLECDDKLGTFSPGRPASFIEVGGSPASLDGKTADQVILESILKMNPAELDRYAAHPSLAALGRGGLESAVDLNWLAEDFQQTVSSLDKSVVRVTIEGRTMWEAGDS